MRELMVRFRMTLRALAAGSIVLFLTLAGDTHAQREATRMTATEWAQQMIAELEPLPAPRGERLPFIVWRLQNVEGEDSPELRDLLRALDERGIATVTAWQVARRERNLPAALERAAVLKAMGLPVVVHSSGVVHRFFNGDPSTAHVDAAGEPFFDLSHSSRVQIGCPFAVGHRYPAIAEQVETYVKAYKEKDLPLDIVIADWEIDGPLEWNDAWAHAKRCTRCRESIPDIDDFRSFQRACRTIRCDMQKQAYADVVLRYYPDALVGNYAEYAHNGWRYWYDYFEEEATDDQPYKLDQKERFRPWYQGFDETGYSFAMPVVYTWYRTFKWYDFDQPDYRWFYNMLKVATNAATAAPADLPVITFVHWHTTAPPKDPDPAVKQMSQDAYQELLWHMLLRGHDGLAMWCTNPETLVETRLVQEVYAQSQRYANTLAQGTPVAFEVPPKPAAVVSAMRHGDRLLVRRTDFGSQQASATIRVDGKTIEIPPRPGTCQWIDIPK